MATYYWVGGSGTWDGAKTANWPTTPAPPRGSWPQNSADTVIFDANSGTETCTTADGSACAVATLNSASIWSRSREQELVPVLSATGWCCLR